MTYIELLVWQIDCKEITFSKACDFLEEHGIKFIRGVRLMNEARVKLDERRYAAILGEV